MSQILLFSAKLALKLGSDTASLTDLLTTRREVVHLFLCLCDPWHGNIDVI